MAHETGKAGLAHLRLLSDALAELCTAQTREDIVRTGAQLARRLCDIDCVSLALRTGEQLHHAVTPSANAEAWVARSTVIGSVASCVFQSRAVVVVPDARQDERTRAHTKGDTRARSFIALPVGAPVGIAALIMSRNEEHWPDAEELLVLETIARAAGLALQAQLSAEQYIGRDQETVGEWLESHAGGDLCGAEREQALLAAQIRHRVRNVLSLVRSTARLQASARGVLGFAFDDLMTDALLLSATSARQEAAMVESTATASPVLRDRTELTGRAILVVEDDYFIAEELCRTLNDQGALVVGPAVDAPEARNLMDRQLLDCAVLDVNLHGEHVFALAHELRARSVPVIFATGYDREFLPDVFRDSGYLQKPIDAAALISAVRSTLRQSPSRHN